MLPGNKETPTSYSHPSVTPSGSRPTAYPGPQPLTLALTCLSIALSPEEQLIDVRNWQLTGPVVGCSQEHLTGLKFEQAPALRDSGTSYKKPRHYQHLLQMDDKRWDYRDNCTVTCFDNACRGTREVPYRKLSNRSPAVFSHHGVLRPSNLPRGLSHIFATYLTNLSDCGKQHLLDGLIMPFYLLGLPMGHSCNRHKICSCLSHSLPKRMPNKTPF